MTFATVDYTTNLGVTRLLIPDVNPLNALFQDEQINAFLTLQNNNTRLAAAVAIETIARNEAMVQKVIRLMDFSTNGPATAKALLDAAQKLRDENANGAGDFSGYFDWAEEVFGPFSARERLWDQMLRGQH